MNKKGFTLIEVMGVVVLISLVFLLVFPTILNKIKNAQESIDKNTEKIIISAAKDYINDNKDDYRSMDGNIYCIDINQLVDEQYLSEDIINSKDNNLLNYYVKIKQEEKNDYDVVNKCEKKVIQKLEYIKSTGTQYIDTGVLLENSNENAKIVYEMDFEESNSGAWQGVNGWMQQKINKSTLSDGNNSLSFEKDKNLVEVSYLDKIEKITINNDKSISRTWNYNGQNIPIVFFRLGDPNNSVRSGLSVIGKLYFAKIYIKEKLVRDFIPVLDQDNKPCLYDKVEKKFYYNQGTGEFEYE